MFRIWLLTIVSLMLNGCFPAIFTATTGATMAVAKDRSLGNAVDDAKILANINAHLMKGGFKKLYAKIHTEVFMGRVLYTGTVESEEDIIAATDIAWKQAGVVEVANELKIDEKSNRFDFWQYTKDSAITSHLKSKLIANRDIKFVNYTVVTMNNIIYLSGIARSEQELEKVADIASKIGGVEKVVSHVIVKEEIEAPIGKGSFEK